MSNLLKDYFVNLVGDDITKYGETVSIALLNWVISDEGSWGERVSSLKIVKQGADVVFCDSIGGVAVDSGQCGFFLKSKYDKYVDADAFYDEVCEITTNGERCGLVVGGWGVVSESGYGDGVYGVSVSREEDTNLINGAEIVFIDDEYDEDDE